MNLKWKSCLRAGVTVLILFLITQYWNTFMGIVKVAFGAASPLLLGCIIAYIVNILMEFFESHLSRLSERFSLRKWQRPFCMILAFISIIFIIFLVIRMIVPELINCVQILVEEVPDALTAGVKWLEENEYVNQFFQGENSLIQLDQINWRDSITKIIDALYTGLGGAMGVAANIVSSVFSTLVTALVALIFSIYLLIGKERIGNQFKVLANYYLPSKIVAKISYFIGVLDNVFHNFIVGQCTEAVILGVLCMIGMLILQLPYAAMIGCLIGFTALIPVAGAYIGAVVGAFMIFTVSPIQSVVFLVYLTILQQLEGNLIYPRVVGSSIGLPGVWVLAAVTVGGGVMGIGGMLLGVPLAATLYKLIDNDIHKNTVTITPPEEESES